MRLPIDVTLLPQDDTPPDIYRHLEDITAEFGITRELAKKNISEAQEQNRRYHDRKAVNPNFILGDQVLVNNLNKTKGLNPK